MSKPTRRYQTSRHGWWDDTPDIEREKLIVKNLLRSVNSPSEQPKRKKRPPWQDVCPPPSLNSPLDSAIDLTNNTNSNLLDSKRALPSIDSELADSSIQQERNHPGGFADPVLPVIDSEKNLPGLQDSILPRIDSDKNVSDTDYFPEKLLTLLEPDIGKNKDSLLPAIAARHSAEDVSRSSHNPQLQRSRHRDEERSYQESSRHRESKRRVAHDRKELGIEKVEKLEHDQNYKVLHRMMQSSDFQAAVDFTKQVFKSNLYSTIFQRVVSTEAGNKNKNVLAFKDLLYILAKYWFLDVIEKNDPDSTQKCHDRANEILEYYIRPRIEFEMAQAVKKGRSSRGEWFNNGINTVPTMYRLQNADRATLQQDVSCVSIV